MQSSVQQPKKGRFFRALSYARPHRLAIFVIVTMTLIVSAANAAEPLIMKFIFDRLGARNFHGLMDGIALLIAAAVLREIAGGLSNWYGWRTRLALHYGLLDATVERLHRLPQDVHRKEGVGAIMSRLDRSIWGFIGAITEISFNVLPALVYLVIVTFVMLQLDWRLTLVLLGAAPLPALIAARAAPKQARREQNLLDRWAKIYGRFNEILSGIVTVRSFAMEDAEKRRFLHDVAAANGVVGRGIGFDSIVGGFQNGAVAAGRIAAVAFGGILVLRGEATFGTLVAFMGYVGGVFGPVQSLIGIYRIFKTATASLDQVFSILDSQDHLGDAPDATEADRFQGDVRFDRVYFAYGYSGELVLRDIDLHVRPGERVAIVGPSGSGKTTMMALLQRLYDPTQGAVLVDGLDLRELKQKSIRQQIGIVLQEVLLFNESVRENICYGRPCARMEEVVAAATAANAHGFITELEEGYDTVLGERGGRLSPGQRQRIAIARALLMDPPILILDEATSALDVELEALIQEAVDHLVEGRTTFIIAHRLSTVMHADKIVVLRAGRIAEVGTHEELLKRGGHYAAMFERYTRGYRGPERRGRERRREDRRQPVGRGESLEDYLA